MKKRVSDTLHRLPICGVSGIKYSTSARLVKLFFVLYCDSFSAAGFSFPRAFIAEESVRAPRGFPTDEAEQLRQYHILDKILSS